MYKKVLALALASALAIGFAQESGGGESEVGNVNDTGIILITTRSPSSYVATADGIALYTLVDDNGNVLPCPAECLQSWPAFTGAATADAGTGLNPDLVSTTQTEDGQEQVTYNEYPLYTYSGDNAPVDVTGQAVEGFGGTWYVVGEDGQPFIEEPTTGEGQ